MTSVVPKIHIQVILTATNQKVLSIMYKKEWKWETFQYSMCTLRKKDIFITHKTEYYNFFDPFRTQSFQLF